MDVVWQQRGECISPPEWQEAQTLRAGEITEFLLATRGIPKLEQSQFLQCRLQDLRSPFLMHGMKEATDRFLAAFRKNEKICVYADFDLDGTSGCALLSDGLKQLGFQNVSYYQPLRLQEGYGFHASAVEALASQGIALIVTVDVGIGAIEAGKRAKELGVDVIITDHHSPGEVLPECFALINPNLKACTSGLGYLSGAGVGFYLLRAIKRVLVDSGCISESTGHLQSLLDLVALATVTDMVPLKEDNRILVREGLRVFARTLRPGLRGLLERLDLAGRPLNTQDIGVKLAPKLNALSRLELGIRPLDILLMTETNEKLLSEVLNQNQNRVDLQAEGEELARAMLASGKSKYDSHVFVYGPQFHRGVVGLIATRLAAETGLPTFVGSLSPDGGIVGSARRPASSDCNLVEALTSAKEHLVRAGGHPAASGFEIPNEGKIESFQNALHRFFCEKAAQSKARQVPFDLTLNLAGVTLGLLRELESIGPYGVEFPSPALRLVGAHLESVVVMKAKHLKLKLRSQNAREIFEAVWFSVPDIDQKMSQLIPGAPLDLIGELQWNYFGIKTRMQILVHDIMVRGKNGEVQTQISVPLKNGQAESQSSIAKESQQAFSEI